MGIIAMIVIGFVVGVIARLLKPGPDSMGFIFTTLLGIAGAVIAGFLGRILGLYEVNQPVGFIASVVGAMLLLFIIQGVFNRRTA